MKKIIVCALIIIGMSLSSTASAQWAAPTSAPPDGNPSGPINTSSTAQTKIGGMILNTGGASSGLLIPYGNVGIGTLAPVALFDISIPGSGASAETPCKTNCPAFNAFSGNMNAGYSFTPLVNGQITALWARGTGSQTVRLYNASTQAVLATAVISGSGNSTWVSSSITPVSVTAGTTYIVTTYGASSGYANVYNMQNVVYGNIRFVTGRYHSSETFPSYSDWTLYHSSDVSFTPSSGGGSSVTPIFNVTNAAKVGINKSSPGSTLDVAGDVKITAGPLLSSSHNQPWKGWANVYSSTLPNHYVQSEGGQARVELLTVNKNDGNSRAVFSGTVVGGTLANPAATPNGSNAHFRFVGYDGSSFNNAGEVSIMALQQFSVGNMPTEIRIAANGYSNTVGQLLRVGPNYIYSSTNITNISDKSLKEDISPLSGSLEKILKLRGVSFSWKESGVKSIGLVAQEVEKVYPELVSANPEGLKGVAYEALVAPLIEAIKEQQRQIEELRAEVEALKASI